MSCVSVAISVPQYVLLIIVNSIQRALCLSRVKDSETRCWSTRSVILLCEKKALHRGVGSDVPEGGCMLCIADLLTSTICSFLTNSNIFQSHLPHFASKSTTQPPTTPTLLFLTTKNSDPALYYIFKRLMSLSWCRASSVPAISRA